MELYLEPTDHGLRFGLMEVLVVACCVLAAYYLNAEFTKEMVDDLMQSNHDQ